MQADAFDGYNQLYKAQRKPAPILEAACWSHGRRKFVDLVKQGEAPIASEAVVVSTCSSRSSAALTAKRRSSGLPCAVNDRGRSLPSLKSGCASSGVTLHQERYRQGDQLPSQPLGSVHPLPRRRPRLSYEQRRRTSFAGCGGRKKKLDLRRFRRWRPSRRRHLYPDRNLQDERRRSASLAR